MAKQFKLDNAEKKDSTGICFIGERKFSDFIKEYLLDKPGAILDTENRQVGKHNGLFYYTIGQRKGLGIGGMKDSPESPWFVVEKDTKNNTLICAQGMDHPRLYHNGLIANDIHWFIEPNEMGNTFKAKVRIRHRQDLQSATIRVKNSELIAEFKVPQRAISPGQSIAIYIDNCLIGSAIIQSPVDLNA